MLLTAETRPFDDSFVAMHSLLPHRRRHPDDQNKFIDDYGFGRYLLTHKLRSFVARERGREISGCFAGDRMSLQNKGLHEELGNPSVERFKSLVDPEDDANIADIECFFNNCAVGDVITRFVPGRTANKIMELRDDLVKDSRADVLELKRQAAQAARVSMDVE